MRGTPEERFWAKVVRVGGCLLWAAHLDRDGYGRFWFDGKKRMAHRVAFFFSHGRWPSESDHTCRRRNCVNEAHLEEVTNRENTARGLSGALYPGKTSKYVGVRWDVLGKKWRARARIAGEHVHLGMFSSEEAAAEAYRRAVGGLA